MKQEGNHEEAEPMREAQSIRARVPEPGGSRPTTRSNGNAA